MRVEDFERAQAHCIAEQVSRNSEEEHIRIFCKNQSYAGHTARVTLKNLIRQITGINTTCLPKDGVTPTTKDNTPIFSFFIHAGLGKNGVNWVEIGFLNTISLAGPERDIISHGCDENAE